MRLMHIVAIFALLWWPLAAGAAPGGEKELVAAIRARDLAQLARLIDNDPTLTGLLPNGKTGLYYAITNDNFEAAEYLLRRGASPEAEVEGHTPLHWAIRNRREPFVRLLVEYGADVNRPDPNLDTPLIYAARLDLSAICKTLISLGADPLHVNARNNRAADYVVYYGNPETFRYLSAMEKFFQERDTVPSFSDGPYVFLEEGTRWVMTWLERDSALNRTRKIERTIMGAPADTLVQGIDDRTYRLIREFSPGPSEITTQSDIFVIGDLHGRYDALLPLLANNRVTGPDHRWAFGSGHLVLLGDVFDRGDRVTELLWFIYDLQEQAREAGGDVHLLLGNHEIMALTGDHRYLDEKYAYFTSFLQTNYDSLYGLNTVIGRWLRSRNIILKINDLLMMHAGISPAFAAYDLPYEDVNRAVRDYLDAGDKSANQVAAKLILGPDGPLWFRGFTNAKIQEDPALQQFIDDYLDTRGLKKMILAHNEQYQVTASFNGRIISADVKIDESGKTAQGLLISGQRIFVCLSDGTQLRLE
jgi:hypothetical protein